MSIRSYFKPKDGLPDLRGSLSSCLPSQAIPLANKEVEKVTSDTGKQRGQEVRRTIFERCVAPSHISAFPQLLPPIFLCTHGSLEYNRLFRTPPCQIARISWRRKCTRVKMFRVKIFSLPGWATKIFKHEIFHMK